ncbi:hypothetical protein [Cystobacter fuscus]|uniref:hypothetical protein n=1 Tax=Cystobacter fuscus TaxID=43 RepID=UPI002B2C34CD|nr:hypothetical protein F0U63_41345 [Cystobacter fuscus]
MISPDIIPNLFPVAASALGWLVSPWIGENNPRRTRGMRQGSAFAFMVTLIGAVPAIMLSWSVNGRSLGMGFMITLILAVVSSVVGLGAFALGFRWGSNEEDQEEPK